MESPPVAEFRSIIFNILNRWTGLRMAVEHQMGGRRSGEKALGLLESLLSAFTSNADVEPEDIEDLLVEYMDREYNTELEDDSPHDVAQALVRLFALFLSRGLAAAESDLQSWPTVAEWLDVVPRAAPPRCHDDSFSDSDDDELDDGIYNLPDSRISEIVSHDSGNEDMEDDDGWTLVSSHSSRKKK